MRTIKYYHAVINDKKMYLAKEKEDYIFIGSFDAPFEEMNQFFSQKECNYDEGNQAEFQEAIDQLIAYDNGHQVTFDLPLKFAGTELQEKVWKALLEIPYGTLVTYKELASKIGHPKAIRAVASSVGKNPLLIVVPCHRVVGSDGKLRGYRGGMDNKANMLAMESGEINGS